MVRPKTKELTQVPFFRPSIHEAEIEEVLACLRSGWLTSGPRVKKFETLFARAVGAKHAVAVNSCTAALHLAVEALRLGPGDAVLVPTMTFAATAEVVCYQKAVPVLVDCDPVTLNMDLEDAAAKLEALQAGQTPLNGRKLRPVGIIPVHVGGLMMDMDEVRAFAERHRLWLVEDAAHALPAAYRAHAGRGTGDGGRGTGEELDAPPVSRLPPPATRHPNAAWRHCGENTSAVSCFSFYANKTITTGEGGMAVTDDGDLAGRMRMMSLHGLSHDAWNRFSGNSRKWDYQIVGPGFKYNLTDIAAAIGIHQLDRADAMRVEREVLARRYLAAFADVDQLELPPDPADRIHSWHLFPIRLRLERLSIDRNHFLDLLRGRGVGCSVHWRPLHLHPYYEMTYGWKPHDLPVATAVWKRMISLPLFPGMREDEQEHVITVVRDLCTQHAVAAAARRSAPAQATLARAARPAPATDRPILRRHLCQLAVAKGTNVLKSDRPVVFIGTSQLDGNLIRRHKTDARARKTTAGQRLRLEYRSM